MWVIGHSAIAYLLIKLIYIGLKKEISSKLLIFIFLFANILDSLHYGPFRLITHNLIGAIIYSGIWIIIFIKLNLIYKNESIILYIAVFTHILGDILCSSFYLFFPLSLKKFNIWDFNSIEHLVFEFIISFPFVIIFITSKDYQNFTIYLKEQKQNIKQAFNKKHIFQKNILLISLFILYYLFILAQFLKYFLDFWSNATIGISHLILKSLFFSLFLGYVYIFSMLIIKAIFNN